MNTLNFIGRNQYSGLALRDRFDSMTMPIAETGCIMWLGAIPNGYGYFWIGSKAFFAHRWNYEQYRGPVPDNMVLDHKCRNTWCVNPAHLEVVTQRENILRGNAPAAKQFKQTHCKRGHLLSEDNIYRNKGHRTCKLCYRIREEIKTGRPSTDERIHRKLSGQDVLRMRGLRGTGLSYKKIATQFKISAQQAWNVINKRHWGGV